MPSCRRDVVDDVLGFGVPAPVPVPDVVVVVTSTPVAPASGGKQVKHEMGSTWVQRIDVGPWTSQKCAREIRKSIVPVSGSPRLSFPSLDGDRGGERER